MNQSFVRKLLFENSLCVSVFAAVLAFAGCGTSDGSTARSDGSSGSVGANVGGGSPGGDGEGGGTTPGLGGGVQSGGGNTLPGGGGGIVGAGGGGGGVGGSSPDAGNPCPGNVCTSRRVLINMGETPWKFALQDPAGAEAVGFDDSKWLDVGIPHSWNDVDRFVNAQSGDWAGDGDPVGAGPYWYRKHFKIDAQYADRKVLIEFEGAHMGVRVFINGKFIPGNSAVNPQATHVIGFVPFVVDVTDQVKKDGSDNVLAVNIGMAASWFQDPGFASVPRFGQGDGGLFRPVWMHLTDRIHVPQNVYSVLNTWGTTVGATAVSSTQATIKIQTNVQNESAASADVKLTSQIVDASGNVVASVDANSTIASKATYMFDQSAVVNNPILWYPNTSLFGKPYMYKVYHLVQVGGKLIDAFVSPLGIRLLTWDKDYPYYNGKTQYMSGVSSRYDYPALGTAVPDEQQWRDVKIAAEAGASLWRPGHSSSSPEFVDACDYYGVAIVQPSGEGEGAFSPAFISDYKKTLKSEVHRDMIVRDRNHPSILAWEASNGPMDTAFAQSLIALGKQWDPIGQRVQADRTPNSANGYILGCTLNGCENLVKSQHPDNPAWGSEYWGLHASRWGWDVELAFAGEFLNNWRKSHDGKAFGMAQWYLAETPGESGPYLEGTQGTLVRYFGSSMMDPNRIPKFLYYIYKAAWNPFSVRPTVALAHHWNRQGTVRVNAFSNCPKVRLKVNGTQVGADMVPNPWTSDASNELCTDACYTDKAKLATGQNATTMPFQTHWDVPWAAGTLRAECLDAGGAVVTFDEKKTAGAPDHIELTVDPALVKPTGRTFAIRANATDAAFVLARVVDKEGNWVPTASNLITFATSGPGNYRGGTDTYVTAGKPSTYHAPLDHELMAEGGMCKVAVRSTFTPGTVTITATSPGLTQGTVSFTTVPPTAFVAPLVP